MSPAKPYLAHLSTAGSLITSHEATRSGFVAAALEKNRLADPFVAEARTLKVKASKASNPKELLTIPDITSGLLTAAGISDKAISHLIEEDRSFIINEFIEKILEPAGNKFVEELVYRFLLIRGDTLGGKIRNIAGAWAQHRLTRYIISDMQLSGRPFFWLNGETRKWRKKKNSHAEVENIRGIAWWNDHDGRVLLYNLKVPIIKNEEENAKSGKGKSVDICLFHCDVKKKENTKFEKERYLPNPDRYLALGELKGGIDPAGADEHWKTANSALRRIRESFDRIALNPAIFFVGGAIEESMADEIWGLLSNDQLTNAANLNDEKQMVSLVSWLCNL